MKSNRKTLTEEEVKHVAKLAAIELTEAEIKKFQEQLSQIIDYVQKLNQVNTSQVEVTSQVTGLTNVARDDHIDKNRILTDKQAVSNAKSKSDDLFKVRAIFEEDENV